MSVKLPEKATQPTMYFIGVTTSQSSIMKVFPLWSEALGLGAVLKGIDLKIHDEPEEYRKVVFIKMILSLIWLLLTKLTCTMQLRIYLIT